MSTRWRPRRGTFADELGQRNYDVWWVRWQFPGELELFGDTRVSGLGGWCCSAPWM